jgi:hypothetical protein
MENHRHRTALARRTDRRALQITSATPTMTKQNRTMIFCPKSDGTYVVEFRTAAGESLAISILILSATSCRLQALVATPLP